MDFYCVELIFSLQWHLLKWNILWENTEQIGSQKKKFIILVFVPQDITMLTLPIIMNIKSPPKV
jgi:hypothetical protein